MELTRTVNGAGAGALAALAWAAQQPLDKLAFGSSYDDVELLGKAVTRGPSWPLAGVAMHAANGAVFGAAYAQLRPFLPGPPAVRGALAGLAEHVALWPLVRLVDRVHPARSELTPLSGNTRAYAQAAWRHALFGAILGEIEHRLNARLHEEPPPVPASSNGHGNITSAAVTV
ncbi:MAG TPA: hypothetical protein VNT32_10880 [Thermoleophilaceae bacterium]|nr:hypothetical protein [Thermoleophilaceae bacterium]